MQFSRLIPFAFFAFAFSFPVYAAESGGGVSLWTQLTVWLLEQQRDYHRELTTALKSLSQDGGWASAGALIFGSFLYGVFHAAGPGHGKAVLTSYLLSHGENLRRSLLMAILAAFCQGVIAIIIVYGLIYLAGWLPRETSSAVQWSERLSYFLVAVLGAWLAYRALKSIYNALRNRKDMSHTELYHEDGHVHGAGAASCGHDHLPNAKQMEAAGDWRRIIGVALSIGMRPCSGAIVVLVFAKAFGIAWSGIGAVFAMSAGTAITVAGLALLAIKARSIASSLVKSETGNWTLIPKGIALLGGVLILAIGVGLLSMSFGTAHPLRL